jgi:hypothetical protein
LPEAQELAESLEIKLDTLQKILDVESYNRDVGTDVEHTEGFGPGPEGPQQLIQDSQPAPRPAPVQETQGKKVKIQMQGKVPVRSKKTGVVRMFDAAKVQEMVKGG